MAFTTDPNDPQLGHGPDDEPGPQNEKYLILSEAERAKGYVRPVRLSYRHVGEAGPEYPLRDLTAEEQQRFEGLGYVKYEKYPEPPAQVGAIGRYWTQAQLDRVGAGCGTVTTMAWDLAETYAREPHFYGSTYCVGCRKHLNVSEFVWDRDNQRVGS